MGDIAFFGILLTLMVLSGVFQEHTEIPENLTNNFPAYEYADPLNENDLNFNSIPSTSLSEDNAKFPAEKEEISSEYGEYYVTEEHIDVEPTGTLPTEMGNFHQGEDDVTRTFTTAEPELNATTTMEEDMYTNNTSVTLAENIPLSTAFILIKFATVMLTMINFAFFITSIMMMWNNNFSHGCIKYEIIVKMNPNNPMLVNEDCEDTFTI